MFAFSLLLPPRLPPSLSLFLSRDRYLSVSLSLSLSPLSLFFSSVSVSLSLSLFSFCLSLFSLCVSLPPLPLSRSVSHIRSVSPRTPLSSSVFRSSVCVGGGGGRGGGGGNGDWVSGWLVSPRDLAECRSN